MLIDDVMSILLEGKDISKISASLGRAKFVEHSGFDDDGSPKYIHDDEVDPLNYDYFYWESHVYPKPTEEEFIAAVEAASALAYREQRRKAYPTIEEQLDTLYHEGYDGWRQSILTVKDKFPKPQ